MNTFAEIGFLRGLDDDVEDVFEWRLGEELLCHFGFVDKTGEEVGCWFPEITHCKFKLLCLNFIK